MRVLLTGGAGFVGSHVATALLDAGHEVLVLGALLADVHPGGWPDDLDRRAERLRADVRALPDSALHGVVVCHQAAVVGLGLDLQDLPLYVAALEVAFDAAPLPLALVDQNGTLRRVNPALAALLGYSEAELVGRPYADLTPAEDVPLDLAATQRLRDRQETSGSVDKRLLHRDGRALWVRVTVTAVQHPDGSLWGEVARVEPLVPTDPTAASPPVAGPGSGSAGFWSALHDPLTGAANRLLLTDRITLALAATERDGGRVAVLFCDLDDFKAVNDTFGHERGDQVLTAVVRRLQTTLRPDDTVARLGGDELVVAAHVDTPEHATDLLHRVRAALDQPLGLPADPDLTIGVSVGLAVGGPGSQASQLLAAADQAMYAEKTRRRIHRPRSPE